MSCGRLGRERLGKRRYGSLSAYASRHAERGAIEKVPRRIDSGLVLFWGSESVRVGKADLAPLQFRKLKEPRKWPTEHAVNAVGDLRAHRARRP